MKLASIAIVGEGVERLAIVRRNGLVNVLESARALGRSVPAMNMIAALSTGPQTLAALEDLAVAAEDRGLFVDEATVQYLPPVTRPSKFLCVGKNSAEHRKELMANGLLKEVPTEPTGFLKLPQTMVGQNATVRRPADITTLDYEPELTFIVTRFAHGTRKGEGAAHVGAITLFNDVSAREIQKREVASGTRFWTAKNMPGFAPIGPIVVTLDEIADPFDLWITCRVNGELRLREHASQYMFRIDEVLAHFSRHMPFEPGDLIAMGATKGVAVGQPNAAELYLKPGDVMESGLEGLMTLTTTIA